MRFRSCGFLLRTLLTPSQTSAAKTSVKPLPRQTVGWGFCDAPGACRANETRISVPGSAPGKTESSDPRQPPQGCEQGARPRWRLLHPQKGAGGRFQPGQRYSSAGTVTAKGTLAGQIKAWPSLRGSLLHPSHRGNDALKIILADLSRRPAAAQSKRRFTKENAELTCA